MDASGTVGTTGSVGTIGTVGTAGTFGTAGSGSTAGSVWTVCTVGIVGTVGTLGTCLPQSFLNITEQSKKSAVMTTFAYYDQLASLLTSVQCACNGTDISEILKRSGHKMP